MQDDIAQAVAEKQRKDEYETAELITRGTPSVAARKGIDGGMHPLFAAKTPNGNTGLSDTKSMTLASYAPVPPVPPSVNPPASADGPIAGRDSAANSRRRVHLGGTGNRRARRTGGQATGSARARRLCAVVELRRLLLQPARRRSALAARTTTASTTGAPVKQAAAGEARSRRSWPPRNRRRRSKSSEQQASAETVGEPKERDTAMAGAQPIVPSNSFDNRWSMR